MARTYGLEILIPGLAAIAAKLDGKRLLAGPVRELLDKSVAAIQKDAETHRPVNPKRRYSGRAIGPIGAEVDTSALPLWGQIEVNNGVARPGKKGRPFRTAQALNFARTNPQARDGRPYRYRGTSLQGQYTRGWFGFARARNAPSLRAYRNRAVREIEDAWQASA